MATKIILGKKLREFTVNDLIVYAAKCSQQLKDLGYELDRDFEFKIDLKSTRTLGLCACSKLTKKCVIRLNINHANYSKLELVHDTIMHEMIHAYCPADGHGSIWNKIAEEVNKAYGYNISEFSKGSVLANYEIVYKWDLICPNCNHVWKYERLTKTCKTLQKHPDSKIGHGSCGYVGSGWIVRPHQD